ncbi:fibronectin type III domain-containing protein [Flavobacterium sp. MAH-1]|uniref:Choice-of-anchor J domain-containing protein n=1 Tax=Flavobacterium agri TaxID=2743471 RepID=A0A7Y8Y529_9FLAO|nr:choice-of-anchor J domain-containing protein [Flavobacterium agri]NUY82034.1 fibronectin type III domain-containing protein [Flavobacterium agri]NYA72058.1 choice-of-anchor J domain-containing protein [Flavobacterium agri]
MKNFTSLLALLLCCSAIASNGDPVKRPSATKKTTLDCEPVAVPFYEDFESTQNGLPECSATAYPDNGNAWETINFPGNGFESVTLVGTGSVTEASNKWFFTKGIQLTGGTTYKISYKYGNKSEDTTEKLHVAYGTSATVDGMSTTISTHNSVTGGTPQTVDGMPFTPSASGVYYFGFHMFSDANQWSLLIDDIAIEPFECGVPQNAAASDVTSTTASFSWEAPTSGEPVMMYQYCVVNNNTPIDGPVSTTLTGASYFPLVPGGTYQFFVRSFCSGAWGNWSDAVTFTTPCGTFALPYSQDFELVALPEIPNCTAIENAADGNDWITSENPGNGFSTKALQYSGNGQAASAWFFTPGLELEAGKMYKLSYKYGNNGAGIEKLNVSVGAAQQADAMSPGGPFGNFENISGGEAQSNSVGPFPAVNGAGIYYFGFNAFSDASQGNLYLDDILVEEWICNTPTNIAAADVTQSSATVSWDASVGNTAQVYQFAVTTSEEEPANPEFTPSLTHALDNLEPETTYYIHVRGLCSGVLSEWNAPVSFTTQPSLGFDTPSFSKLKVFPNPVKDVVSVVNTTNIEKIEIRSLLGQLISSANCNGLNADVSLAHVPSGSYILKVYSEGRSATARLLKE